MVSPAKRAGIHMKSVFNMAKRKQSVKLTVDSLLGKAKSFDVAKQKQIAKSTMDSFLEKARSESADLSNSFTRLAERCRSHMKRTKAKKLPSTTSNDNDSLCITTEPKLSDGKFGLDIKKRRKSDSLDGGSYEIGYGGVNDYGVFFAMKEVCLLNQGEEEIIHLQQEMMRKQLESLSFSPMLNDDHSSSTTTEPILGISISNDDDSSSTATDSSTSPNGKFGRNIKVWQKGDNLGCGSFGSVYEGYAGEGFFFAVKQVSLLHHGNEGIIQLEQEIALLSEFEHENIVQYYGTHKDEQHLYIFLELVTQGSLLSLYKKYDMQVPQVSAYTRQILCGLKYLHDKNVVHRDIKCANILVDANGLVKLADFGLAKAIESNNAKSSKGTAHWMAPEVVLGQDHGVAADIWSLGCTVLEMLTRRFPYSDLDPMAALYRIGKGERPPIPDSLSSDARDFILQCLRVDPGSRSTAAQLLDHPFVKGPHYCHSA